ncbi:NUDIX hydrolase [Serratia fonticola]|uniref:NUDIX hydrolase n=1 Tax=Serratia fonticola TaxID=47917 RepID=UPI001AE84D9F|nr:NUDIX domain-containing protein [Serratia fonticola]MBP0997211.1 NUDIX hydrolase [Serratia fonticola]MBP1003038.1 NUDIX hydrolase [Serratia fonticola]MBP1012670.1 NUDIX hydrolase [Serratia fonticola]CAI1060183.1 bifunctional nicotinamide mononucleotide adenylyltransferase/ADP-ribose pyrophosphatase [Serratia fonticola]
MTTQAEYLKNYDPRLFPSPLVTVDNVLFTVHGGKLCVLLAKRANHPFLNQWGLPGGFIDLQRDTSTQATAERKLREKTGVVPPYLAQLASFSGPERDPRGWSLTTVYFALIAHADCQPHIADVNDVAWVPLDNLQTQQLAFDHQTIVEAALQRLRQKTAYSMLPVYCLPAEFTLSQLQEVIEIILSHTVQRKSLMRRFDASEMFEETGERVATGARKARLYRRKAGVDMRNFSRNLMVE